MRKEALRVLHLYKRFGQKEVLTDFHMNLLEGETLGIMGLKGSGKTLLFHILTGKEEFDQGTLFFNEKGLMVNDGAAEIRLQWSAENHSYNKTCQLQTIYSI